MKTLTAICFLLACFFTGNGQVASDSIKVEDYYRSFQFIKPARALTSASLVFVLHGSGGSGEEMMKATIRPVENDRKRKRHLRVC